MSKKNPELTKRLLKEAKRAVRKQAREEHFLTAADVAALPVGNVVDVELEAARTE
jgi:hypothetical protein